MFWLTKVKSKLVNKLIIYACFYRVRSFSVFFSNNNIFLSFSSYKEWKRSCALLLRPIEIQWAQNCVCTGETSASFRGTWKTQHLALAPRTTQCKENMASTLHKISTVWVRGFGVLGFAVADVWQAPSVSMHKTLFYDAAVMSNCISRVRFLLGVCFFFSSSFCWRISVRCNIRKNANRRHTNQENIFINLKPNPLNLLRLIFQQHLQIQTVLDWEKCQPCFLVIVVDVYVTVFPE